MKATLIWNDPEMSWNTSVYNYDEVVLPAGNVWTPELQIVNGLQTSIEDGSKDLLVYSNGTLRHTVLVTTEVDCEVNMFNYPFADDSCPVAVESWSFDGCGTHLVFGDLRLNGGSQGDWKTTNVSFESKGNQHTYILVSLSLKYGNPFITLLLPSFLLVLADVVSFALPVGGGERNGFKVTLVLSFIMFLGILNDELPGDSQCSPVIRQSARMHVMKHTNILKRHNKIHCTSTITL